VHADFEIHGYLCAGCGPIKSLVVLRSGAPSLSSERERARSGFFFGLN
jgi:hypothetical protein